MITHAKLHEAFQYLGRRQAERKRLLMQVEEARKRQMETQKKVIMGGEGRGEALDVEGFELEEAGGDENMEEGDEEEQWGVLKEERFERRGRSSSSSLSNTILGLDLTEISEEEEKEEVAVEVEEIKAEVKPTRCKSGKNKVSLIRSPL